MSTHALGGAVGVLAVLVGIAWGIGAVRRRASRQADPRQYAEVGGTIYTVFQMFFAVVLIAIGVLIVVLMSLGR